MRHALKTIIFLIVIYTFFTAASYAQSVCPADLVCISREAAIKAIADADKVKALEAEMLVKDKSVADYKDLLNEMRVKFAEVSGENTVLKQTQVHDRAIMEVLLKNSRPKKIGLFNLW